MYFTFTSHCGAVTRWDQGNSHLSLALHLPEFESLNFGFIPPKIDEMLRWLITPFRIEEQETIDKGLRRKIFELPRDPKTGFKLRL